MNQLRERAMHYLCGASASVSILSVLLICAFVLASAIPTLWEIGVGNFLLGTTWAPADEPPRFGIAPMIVGSVYITIGAVLLGVPIGICTALFVAKVCSGRWYKVLSPAIDLLAGIPSVVYGFFGMAVLVPYFGHSMASASILLGIMILPTIISLSESAIRAVPEQYYEGAVALGVSHFRSLFAVVLPAARSGIIASVVLGLGRAIGETMAVIMVAGNQARMPMDMLKGARTLTANIAIEMGYAAELHRDALIATGAVLLLMILCINGCVFLLRRRGDA